MKFKVLNENWNLKNFYHCTDADFLDFRMNDEGIHFADTARGALEVSDNRYKESEHLYLYSCSFNGTPKPLYTDVDPYYFGAAALAEIFIAVIKSGQLFSVGSRDRDANGRPINIDVNSREVIHIDNLSDKDLDILERIFNYKEEDSYLSSDKNTQISIDIDNLFQIGKFLETKGYNCVVYPLAESKTADDGILIMDPKYVKIDKKEIIR